MSETELRPGARGAATDAGEGGAAEPSLSRLVGSLLDDTQALVHKEIELARVELRAELEKARQAGIAMGLGAAVAGVGALLLVIMLVQMLIAFVGLAPWMAYMLVGGTLTIIGVMALIAGARRARMVDPVPHEAIESVRKDVEWLKERSPSDRT
jgi:uncharacterized membrane protein YqjE